ncbi:MAG TPA: ABC transporter permease [Ktedonobacterales bacterium]|nr:ABC transporter permease [Ktedonobacterales bacterium]
MFETFVIESSILGVIGLGAGLVLLAGEIDFSLATVAYLCSGIMGVLSVHLHVPAAAAIGLAVLVGAGLGALNGVLVAAVHLPSAYATLMGALVNFMCLGLLEQAMQPETSIKLLDPQVLRLGAAWPSALIFLTLTFALWLALRYAAFGRGVYAVGRDTHTAEQSGARVVAIRVTVFVMASVLAALAGILLVAWYNAALAFVDESLLLFAVAAPIIGGISLFGGRGSIWGVLIGAPLCAAIRIGAGLASSGPNGSITTNYTVVASIGLIVAVTIAIGRDVRRRRNERWEKR